MTFRSPVAMFFFFKNSSPISSLCIFPPVAFRPSADALLSGGDHRQGRRRRREQESSFPEEEEAWDDIHFLANEKTLTKTKAIKKTKLMTKTRETTERGGGGGENRRVVPLSRRRHGMKFTFRSTKRQ